MGGVTTSNQNVAFSALLFLYGEVLHLELAAIANAEATGGEKRWLEGLYLDTPEEWDDPYRFFRW